MGDRLWTIDADGETVVGDGPEQGRAGQDRLGGICTDVNGDDQMLWLACPTDGRVLAVDTDKRKVVADVRLDEPRQVASGDEIWVATAAGVVSPTDVHEVTSRFDVSPGLTGAIWARRRGVVRAEDHSDPDRPEGAPSRPSDRGTRPPSGGDVVSDGTSVWTSAYDDGTVVGLTAR